MSHLTNSFSPAFSPGNSHLIATFSPQLHPQIRNIIITHTNILILLLYTHTYKVETLIFLAPSFLSLLLRQSYNSHYLSFTEFNNFELLFFITLTWWFWFNRFLILSSKNGAFVLCSVAIDESASGRNWLVYYVLYICYAEPLLHQSTNCFSCAFSLLLFPQNILLRHHAWIQKQNLLLPSMTV